MTTISPLRASTYWRERFLGIAASLHAELSESAVYACYETRYTALERLMLEGQRNGRIVEFYPANRYTAFIPCKPALIADEAGRWAVLCPVSVSGRLLPIDAVAVWVKGGAK